MLLLRINNVNVWHGDVLWCHKVPELKAGLLMRSLSSSVYRGKEELLLVLKNLQCIKHWRKGKKQKKHDRSPLICSLNSAHLTFKTVQRTLLLCCSSASCSLTLHQGYSWQMNGRQHNRELVLLNSQAIYADGAEWKELLLSIFGSSGMPALCVLRSGVGLKHFAAIGCSRMAGGCLLRWKRWCVLVVQCDFYRFTLVLIPVAKKDLSSSHSL